MQEYLDSCLAQEEHMSFVPFDAEKWDGDTDKLQMMLHRAGLELFAKAIVGLDESLLWHLCHKLDTGRGSFLRKVSLEEENHEERVVLEKQFLHVLDFLNIPLQGARR